MLYQILLVVGFLGLLIQAGLGALHGQDGHAGHTDSHASHAIDGDVDGHTGHSYHDAAGHTHDIPSLLVLLSPLRIFAFSLGMGATGLLLGHLLTGALLFIVAAVGGVGFYLGVVKPLFKLVFKFVSKPAENLTNSIGKDAVAASRFDTKGRGIITMTVDGQTVRLLATLDKPDEVKKGEKVVIVGINNAAGTCQVTKM
jgi:hypothetical protein